MQCNTKQSIASKAKTRAKGVGLEERVCVVDELKKADELNHSLRSQLHESRQMAVIM